jgi:ABC-type glycerol-3-phosphate transport system substrate-binding protein
MIRRLVLAMLAMLAMKLPLYRLICCACLASLLLACQPAATGPAPIQEPVKLTFIVPEEYRRLYTPAVEKFKIQEPNITIEIRSQGFSAQAGDVTLVRWFDVAAGAGNIENITPLDLTPLLQQDTTFDPTDYTPGSLESFKNGDQQFGLPTGVDPFVIFYNQDLFNQLGVPYPQPGWNLDDFRTTALQISEPSAGIYGYVPSDFYLDCMFFAFQFGTTIVGEQQRLDSPENIQALEWYASLFGAGGAAPNAEQLMDAYEMGGRDVGIVTSKVGMWMGSVTSLTSDLGGMLKFKVGIAPIPRGPQGFSLAQFEGLIISADTPNPQAAWRWVSFLASQPNSWVYPARKSLAESESFTNLFGTDQAAGVRAAIENSTAMSGMDFGENREVIFSYFSTVRSVIDGGIPPAEALQAAQKAITP